MLPVPLPHRWISRQAQVAWSMVLQSLSAHLLEPCLQHPVQCTLMSILSAQLLSPPWTLLATSLLLVVPLQQLMPSQHSLSIPLQLQAQLLVCCKLATNHPIYSLPASLLVHP